MGMCSDAPPSNTTTKTTTEAPAYLQPSILDLVKRSTQLAGRPYTPYKGQQVAPLSYQTKLAQSIIQKRAGGDKALNTAISQNNRTVQGGYLGKGAFRNELAGVDNPYLNSVIDYTNQDVARQFTNSIMPQTDANFARSGAFGGSAWQDASAENNRQMAAELAKNTAGLRFGDYQQQQQLAENLAQRQTQAYGDERQRMMGGIAQALPLSNQRYTDAQNLLGSGDITRDYLQSLNNVGYQGFINKQNWPLQNLDILANAIRTAMGGGGTSVQQAQLPGINRASSMFGGAAAGAGLGSALGGTGTSTAAGAGLGALAGLFS